jgi:geranyl-CoA carboxylase alpha subunit
MSSPRFEKILIANRGEIACRIIRTARALGFATVAVHSEADAGAPHVALADEARAIGPASAAQSYLDVERILEAARATGADAIHPGYGFLSENAAFARAAAAAGLTFIGPPPRAIEIMGDKAGAKRAMKSTGVPCVPGYEGDEQDDERLIAEARRIGFPVMVKASAGGGGRGMRLVEAADALPSALQRARAEALGAFGADRLILERAVQRARHVEIQVFGDEHGHVIHLGERDCSVQRRHQKVIEEAPSPVVTPALRAAMGAAAVEAARAVGYVGAGTVEFLLDPAGAFYFLEMNTRLQVEHPVTELISGLDLVAWQIRVALGEPLPLAQDEVRFSGHAIEARLYAEDAAAGFLPATGRLDLWRPAQGDGVRIDSGVATGFEVSPYYDPMLAKVIAFGPTREEARRRLVSALERSVAFGITTNADFLVDLLQRPDFVEGAATTSFIADNYPEGFTHAAPASSDVAIAAALRLRGETQDALAASTLPDDSLVGFSSTTPLASRLDLQLGEQVWRLAALPKPQGWSVACGDAWRHEIRFAKFDANEATLTCDGRRQIVVFQHSGGASLALAMRAARYLFRPHRPWERATAGAGSGRVVAPMPGIVAALHVVPGQAVEAGDAIAVLEAMKMQHTIAATVSGIVRDVFVAKGQQTTIGAPIADIEETEA